MDNVLVLIIDDVSARRTLVQLILDLRVGDPLRVNRNIKGPNMSRTQISLKKRQNTLHYTASSCPEASSSNEEQWCFVG